MIFIDSNIFMYAAGKDHPFKIPSQKFLEQMTSKPKEALVNTEVLQEILYRFDAINKTGMGFIIFDQIIQSFLQVLSVTLEDLKIARKIQETLTIKSRHAIHAATMKNANLNTIVSYDRDFDKINWIKRMTPSELV